MVRVVSENSEQFPVQRGTRQGCPLSPLLFALAIEALAVWLKMDAQVRGFEWEEGVSDRVALYADDVLIFLSDPESLGPGAL